MVFLGMIIICTYVKKCFKFFHRSSVYVYYYYISESTYKLNKSLYQFNMYTYILNCMYIACMYIYVLTLWCPPDKKVMYVF